MTFNEILGMIMLFGMVGVIFFGFPISFTLLFLALVFGGIGLGWDQTFNLAYLQIWGTMKDEIFPAVPLFIFMGYMTEQAGLMERLFGALRSLLAQVRGALYLAVILTATIFAMATGIVGAAVTVLGIMAGPMMIKSGYDSRLSSGAIAAGGTLGVLIPPSVMLVVMGPTMGVPVNLLYAAAFGPGFLLAGCYIAYTMIRSLMNPKLGPPMTEDEQKEAYIAMTTEKVNVGVLAIGAVALVGIVYVLSDWALSAWKTPHIEFSLGRRKPSIDVIASLIALGSLVPFFKNSYFRAVVLGIAPLAGLIGCTLGTILSGAATPTEAASCGAAGAAILALVYGRLSLEKPSSEFLKVLLIVPIGLVAGLVLGWLLVKLVQVPLSAINPALFGKGPDWSLIADAKAGVIPKLVFGMVGTLAVTAAASFVYWAWSQRSMRIAFLVATAVMALVPVAFVAWSVGFSPTALGDAKNLNTLNSALIPGVTGLAFMMLCLAIVPGALQSPQLRAAAYGTMVTSGMVLFLAVASNVFGAIFTKLGAAGYITNQLTALPLGDWMKLLLIMALVFVLGWPFEWPAIVLVFLPIFLPVVEKFKLTPFWGDKPLTKQELLIWFGALIAVNLQTAFLSPPVAMSAYYLKNVVPQWTLAMIYRGMADYMVIQVVVLALMLLFPAIALSQTFPLIVAGLMGLLLLGVVVWTVLSSRKSKKVPVTA